jgi:competence protein ComEC
MAVMISARFSTVAASPSKTLLATTFMFVAAVLIHAWDTRTWLPMMIAVPFAFAGMAAAIFLRKKPRARLTVLCVAAAIAGIIRFDAAIPASSPTEAPPFVKAAYVGTLAQEPHITLKGATLTMDRVFVSGGARPIGGTVLITMTFPPQAAIGDTLAWTCKMFPPLPVSATNAAFAEQDQPWRCMPGSARIIAHADGGAVANAFAAVRNGIRGVIRALIPEPDASFVLGLLIGDTGGIPKNIIADFRATGTSHVLAVSGYNVTLVAEFAFAVFAFCTIRRRQAAVAVAVSVAAFSVLCGGGASVVRAALMGGVGVIAAILGRRNAGWTALVLAAAVMLAWDPLVVQNVSFQLSFAAVVGMRAFGAPFTRLYSWMPAAFGLRSVCAETTAATVATIPIEMYAFSQLPISALAVNLAIVPFVPFATAVGAAALAFGALWLPLGLPFALAATVASQAMRFFAATGDRFAPALIISISSWTALLLYIFLFIFWYVLTRRRAASGAASDMPDVIVTAYEN